MNKIIEKYIFKNSSKKNTVFLARYLYRNQLVVAELINELMGLVKNENHPIDFRAAWVLEIFFLNHPKFYYPFANQWLDLLESSSDTCKRHIIKVIAKTNFEYEKAGQLVDWCLKEITLKSCPLAVKVYCIYFLNKIVKIFPELKTEFYSALEITNKIHENVPSIRVALKRVKFISHT